jgi:hypothetical protein
MENFSQNFHWQHSNFFAGDTPIFVLFSSFHWRHLVPKVSSSQFANLIITVASQIFAGDTPNFLEGAQKSAQKVLGKLKRFFRQNLPFPFLFLLPSACLPPCSLALLCALLYAFAPQSESNRFVLSRFSEQ